MFEIFYPDEYLDSAYEIDFYQLYEDGFRGVIFDIDNTLVPHGAPADERCIRMIHALKKMGFGVLVLSNNKKDRVEPFAKLCGIHYIAPAAKPLKRNYIKAMELLGTDKSTTVFVGDQLFTDVWGAKRTGIPSILVKPLNSREEIQIVLKRFLEHIVLKQYDSYIKK